MGTDIEASHSGMIAFPTTRTPLYTVCPRPCSQERKDGYAVNTTLVCCPSDDSSKVIYLYLSSTTLFLLEPLPNNSILQYSFDWLDTSFFPISLYLTNSFLPTIRTLPT